MLDYHVRGPQGLAEAKAPPPQAGDDSREVREADRHPEEVEGRGRDREARRGGEAVELAARLGRPCYIVRA